MLKTTIDRHVSPVNLFPVHSSSSYDGSKKNLPLSSYRTSVPSISYFGELGSRSKGQRSRSQRTNRQLRFTAKCVGFSYLFKALRGGRFTSTCSLIIAPWARGWFLLDGTSQDVRKHNIFERKKQNTQKMLIIRQNDWRDVGRPLNCNAFAIAGFIYLFTCYLLVCLSTYLYFLSQD